MKTTIYFLHLIFLCFATPFISNAQTSLTGKVTELETSDPILFGNVALFKDSTLITKVETDFDGNYNISNIEAGTYDIIASYVGLNSTRVTDVIILKNKANRLDIQLEQNAIMLEEVRVVAYSVPLIEQDNTTQGGIVTADQIKTLSSKNINGLANTRAGVGQGKNSKELTIRGNRTSSTDYYVDGIRVRGNNSPPPQKNVKSAKQKQATAPTTAATVQQAPQTRAQIPAGQLTAGEWKDLDSWSFWQDLQLDPTYKQWQNHWNIFPNQRYAVHVVGTQNQALIGATVSLLDKADKTIWQAKTDNHGRAELWSGLFNDSQSVASIRIQHSKKTLQSRNLNTFSKSGLQTFQLPVDCDIAPSGVDIMFAVDATGSMSDEIRYLKAELQDVVTRIQEENADINLHLGTVFYRDRDHAAEKQIEVVPFTKDAQQVIDFIHTQQTIGGNSVPEAVDLALETSLAQDWRADARSRLLFLILDAPPHHRPEYLQSIQKSVASAARQGIKIIPVAASGIKKDTEFLMKYLAVITNSTYTFITDHSGIGNAHLKPTAGNYNVETLNDLMLRLILENTETTLCDDIARAETTKTIPKKHNINNALLAQIRVFPNPVVRDFSIDLSGNFDAINLYDNAGRRVQKFGKQAMGIQQYKLKSLPTGSYYLQFKKGKEVAVQKLIVTQE